MKKFAKWAAILTIIGLVAGLLAEAMPKILGVWADYKKSFPDQDEEIQTAKEVDDEGNEIKNPKF